LSVTNDLPQMRTEKIMTILNISHSPTFNNLKWEDLDGKRGFIRVVKDEGRPTCTLMLFMAEDAIYVLNEKFDDSLPPSDNENPDTRKEG
jgi:hypothetical protein